MKKGDTFTWLVSESDVRFGEKCEVLAVWGDKIDFKFVERPAWRTVIMPMDWVIPKKHYSPEEISAIQKRQGRRRFAEKF